jgi:hypothetical protein
MTEQFRFAQRRAVAIGGALAMLVAAAACTVVAVGVWGFDAVCAENCTDGGARSWGSWAQFGVATAGMLASVLTFFFVVSRRRHAAARGVVIVLLLYFVWGALASEVDLG